VGIFIFGPALFQIKIFASSLVGKKKKSDQSVATSREKLMSKKNSRISCPIELDGLVKKFRESKNFEKNLTVLETFPEKIFNWVHERTRRRQRAIFSQSSTN